MGGGSFPRASPRPVKWIPQLALIALVNGQTLSPKAACSQPFRLASLPERFNDPAPAEIVLQVLGRHAMERAQLFLQATVVTIDVVDMEIGRFRSGAAWLRQDAAVDFRLAGKTDDRLGVIPVTCHQNRDLLCRQGAVFAMPPRLCAGRGRPERLPWGGGGLDATTVAAFLAFITSNCERFTRNLLCVQT